MKAEPLTTEEKDFILTYGSLIQRLSESGRPADRDIVIRYYELIYKYNNYLAEALEQ